MTDYLRQQYAEMGLEYHEPETNRFADALLNARRADSGRSLNIRERMFERLEAEGITFDEPEPEIPAEPVEPKPPVGSAPIPIPPLGSRYGVPTPPAQPSVARIGAQNVPHGDDVTLLCITVWDNWGGTSKPPVTTGKRTWELQWGVSIEVWTDPAATIPTRSDDRMKLVTMKGTTRLLSGERFMGGIMKLESEGAISPAYRDRLIAHRNASKYPEERVGTFQERTFGAGSPYVYDTDCFIEMDVRSGSSAPFSCRLHLNGGTIVINQGDWTDKQVNGAGLPSKGQKAARWQCRFDRDGTYPAQSWRTK